jgi:hypothetical protein
LFLLAPWLTAVAQQDATPPSPPPIDPRRYTEDYSYLRDPDHRTGAWWETGKWIPLGNETALTLGAEVRARYERYRNNEFGDAAVPDEGYMLYRILPYASLILDPHVRAFAQLNLTASNRDANSISPVDDTGNDVLQGFVDLSFPTGSAGELTVRTGRQVMGYGTERLVSMRYGPNVLRSFDGGLAIWQSTGLRVDTFFVRPVRNALDSFNDRSDSDRRFWGIYGTWSEPGRVPGTGMDIYYLGLSDEDASYNQGSGSERRNTLGVRYFGKRSGWSWDLEGMYQYGNFAGARIRAWSVASDVRYTFQDAPLRPRLGMKANFITGDRDPNDPALQTFNPLFPKGKYFGEAGLIGPVNLINLHPSLKPGFGIGLESRYCRGVLLAREPARWRVRPIGQPAARRRRLSLPLHRHAGGRGARLGGVAPAEFRGRFFGAPAR